MKDLRIGACIALAVAGCTPTAPQPSNVGVDGGGFDLSYEEDEANPSTFARWDVLDTEASRAHRRGFSWEDTEPVAEVETSPQKSADDRPALYYTEIFVENPHQLAELEEMQIHFDPAPLFESEWPSGPFTMDYAGDGGGIWVYAMMPGATYNKIRDESLQEGESLFIVQFREVPPEARSDSGGISYEYLGQNGVYFAPSHTEFDEFEGTIYSQHTPQKRFGRRLRKAIQRIRDAVRGVVDAVRTAIGQIHVVVQKDITLEIRAMPVNRDPLFATLVPQRAWTALGAPARGEDLALRGTFVSFTQLGGVSLFKRWTDADGFAKAKVPEGKRTRVCVETNSRAALMETSLMWPIRSCTGRFTSNEANRAQTLLFDTDEFFALSLFQDARNFADEALNYKPRKALIQTGKIAEILLPEEQAAFVPCLHAGSVPVVSDIWSETINLAVSSVLGSPALLGLGPGTWIEFAAAVDIVMRPSALRDRGIAVHEYGHFYFCDLMRDENSATFSTAWSQVMTDSVTKFDSSSEPVILNEGIADWFSSQVAGSVGYFRTGKTVLTGLPSGVLNNSNTPNGIFYFNPLAATETAGMDENLGGTPCGSSFPPWPSCQTTPLDIVGKRVARMDDQLMANKVGRVATILHDFVDGALTCTSLPTGPVCPRKLRNGSPWIDVGGTLVLEKADPWEATDENVAIGGEAITEALRSWAKSSRKLDHRNLMSAFANSAFQRGHSIAEICELFALHSENAQCDPTWLPVIPE